MELFDLPQGQPIVMRMLDDKEAILRNRVSNDPSLRNNPVTLNLTLQFLAKAKSMLIQQNNGGGSSGGGQGAKAVDNILQHIENFYNSSYELKPTALEDPTEHMVQQRKDKPYLSSFPSEFFPGVINPLKKRTIRRNLTIDTRFRDNYFSSSSTNFNVILPINFQNVLQMQLASLELPTTFYTISKQYGNNYFQLGVNGQRAMVELPSGNYSYISLMAALNNQLELLGGPFADVFMQIDVTSGTTGTGQTLVGPKEGTTPSLLELNFQTDRDGNDDNYTPLPLKLGWLLGFRNGKYVGNSNYVSEGVVDITGPRYFYLVIDDYNNNVNNGFFTAFNNSLLNKNILARISLQSQPFNILEQNNLNLVTTPRDYFGPVNLTSMTVQLLDEYGRIVNLNNMDFSFCLTLVTVYDL